MFVLGGTAIFVAPIFAAQEVQLGKQKHANAAMNTNQYYPTKNSKHIRNTKRFYLNIDLPVNKLVFIIRTAKSPTANNPAPIIGFGARQYKIHAIPMQAQLI